MHVTGETCWTVMGNQQRPQGLSVRGNGMIAASAAGPSHQAGADGRRGALRMVPVQSLERRPFLRTLTASIKNK